METIVFILIATVLGVTGQLMLKHGMGQMGPLQVSVDTFLPTVWRMMTAPFVVGGLLIYGFGTFFWLVTLSRLDLSYAYPFVSLNIVIIFFFSWLIMREDINPLRAAGMIVICAGILLVARS
jgi:multidrug transporter EmrE-like cation transporter